MTMRRMVMTAGGAVLPVALIALVFGNQWAVDAVRGEARDGGLWQLVHWLQTPQWHLYPESFFNWGYVISVDIGLILFFALIAGLTAVGVRAVDPNRGMLGAAVTGWWACVVAGGVSGLVTGTLVKLSLDDGPSFDGIVWGSIAGGAAFGLVYGWLAGLGALAGFHLTRDRGTGGGRQAQQQFGQQPYQQQFGQQQPYQQQPYQQQFGQQQFGQGPHQPQPGAPMQPTPGQPVPGQPVPGQPYAPPQHPANVPYVPPQGGPQQPAWGAAPQQPGVPQQPPAPEQPAPDAPTLDPPTQADDEDETVPAGSEEAPAAGGGDLADKTMLDHDPEAGDREAGDDRPPPPA
ncbi:hypothetical protein [Actinomadura sediminis]|uniref:Uncharacterized protein n=1 Tax=Actinomadura sediminis TaxID=1038904 RepID=A0ABW3EQY1_9ACTN